jgi:hypothetical protein
VKIPRERPDSVRAITSVFALFYLGFIGGSMILDLWQKKLNLEYIDYSDLEVECFLGIFIMVAGGFLIRDLIKQVSLFRSTQEKK